MAVIQVVVCDICKVVGKPVREYTANRKEDGKRFEVALCESDDLLAEYEVTDEPEPAKAVTPTRRASRRSAPKLTTLAEIEASKKH